MTAGNCRRIRSTQTASFLQRYGAAEFTSSTSRHLAGRWWQTLFGKFDGSGKEIEHDQALGVIPGEVKGSGTGDIGPIGIRARTQEEFDAGE